jgi:hypothetical protein
MKALRIALFVVVVGAAALASLFLLPWLKEGHDIEELPLFASIAAALAGLELVWWVVHRRRFGGLFAWGATALAVPLLTYACLSLRLVWNDWQGRRLARTVKVVALRETEIRWPRLDGPVGVRLEIDVEHAIGRRGFASSPRILMGTDPHPDRRDYNFGPFDHGVDDFLERPISELPAPQADAFARSGRTTLAYELFPGTLQRRDGSAVCLVDPRLHPGKRVPAPASGSDLGAAWFFVAEGGPYVDLSAPLTEALRGESRFQGDLQAWGALMRRLEPPALESAGYSRCVPPRPGQFEACYCPPGS